MSIDKTINSICHQLDFAFRLQSPKAGLQFVISLFGFPIKISVHSTDESIESPKQLLPDEDAQAILENSLLCATAAFVMALDELLLDHHGGLNRQNRESGQADLDDLWAVIYQLRCCFAHGILRPRWGIVA